MKFTSIIGHEALKQKLSVLVNKPQAFLFYGPPSTGKRTVAFEFARYVLCTGSQEDGCICPSCKGFSFSPDFLYVGKDKILLQDIENLGIFTSRAPLIGKTRVVIIDNSEHMSKEVFTRLLKVVEETSYVFIFISSVLEANSQTIRSRCLKVQFNALTQEDYTNIFWKKFGFELSQARVLGWIGSFTAQDIFSSAGQILKLRDQSIEFADLLSNGEKNSLKILEFIDKIENLKLFIDVVILILTDILGLKNNLPDILNSDKRSELQKTAEKFDYKNLLVLLNMLSQIKKNDFLSPNYNLLFKSIIINYGS
jgi:DNA polymerase III gamma/tau subunit